MTANNDAFDEKEAQRRLEAALRGARQVPPIKMKDIPRKRPYRARKSKPAPATEPKSA